MYDRFLSPPPLPKRGDDDINTVYLGVGKVVSGWETVEFELARLYSVLARDPDGPCMREYGEPSVPRYRIEKLARFAEKTHFKLWPSQQAESILTG
jgi:hypothetical protein